MLQVDRAAIKDDSGTIWSIARPARHHDIIAFMRKNHYKGPVGGNRQGFILSNGVFASREDSLEIALKANQVKNGKIIGSVLTSEDMW